MCLCVYVYFVSRFLFLFIVHCRLICFHLCFGSETAEDQSGDQRGGQFWICFPLHVVSLHTLCEPILCFALWFVWLFQEEEVVVPREIPLELVDEKGQKTLLYEHSIDICTCMPACRCQIQI